MGVLGDGVEIILHEGVEVEYQCLQVLWAFIEFPDLLVAAGDIVKDADDDIFIDGFAAAGSILQDLFCFVEIHKCLFRSIDIDAFFGIAAELNHALQELL